MESGSEEASLVAEAVAGNRDAFATLCERYRLRVWKVAASVAGGSDADDLAQEALTRAFASLRGYRGEAPFGAWLCRIALNVAYDFQRSAWKRRVVFFQRPPDRIDVDAACPLGEAVRRDAMLRVRREVALLPANLRTALWLHYFEEVTVEELARLERVPESTIRSRMRTGLRRLSLALRDLVEIEPQRLPEHQRCEA